MKELLGHPDVFGRIHHRFLNDLDQTLSLRTHCGRHPGYLEIAEGDVCWYEKGGETKFLMMHPEFLNRLPPVEELVARAERGEILTLDRLLASDLGDLRFMIEIKAGHGDMGRAMERLLTLLEDRVSGRYCIDCFSPRVLGRVKEVAPAVPTSLHTRVGVLGSSVVKTAFEWPPLSLRRLSRLEQVDVVTVTYKYSPARYLRGFGATVDGLHRGLFEAGKRLVFGGIGSREIFERVQATSAVAAYWKFEKHLFATPHAQG